MAKHSNNKTECPKCEEIILRYGGIFHTLKDWFYELREKHPEAHISCAGRNEAAQQDAYDRGLSKATFGKSPHNYVPTPAIDIFELGEDGKAHWRVEWFDEVVGKNLATHLSWGGNWTSFKDYPHVEIANWRFLKDMNQIKLLKKK